MPKTVVKKVKAYPFAAQVKTASGAYAAQVVKLTLQGLMIEVIGTAIQTGETLEINFETPVLHESVVASGVVVKVYNQLTGATQTAPAGGAIRILEVHFRAIANNSMAAITQFLDLTKERMKK